MYTMIYQVIKIKEIIIISMDGSDRIMSMLYIRKYILAVRTYYFNTGMSLSKDMEHIKERIVDFGALKEEARRIQITCNTIQTSI